MKNFDEAIQLVKTKLEELQSDATSIKVGQALIGDDNKRYEITFSYAIKQDDNLQLEQQEPYSNMAKLSSLLRQRKVYQTCLVHAKAGAFRGFKIYQAG